MNRLVLALLILALAGCMSDPGNIFQQSEVAEPAQPSIEQSVPQVAPASNVPLSPAARAAAPADVNMRSGELLDCVTQSCKINCSPNVKKQFRPKWCARFKEPVEN